MNEALTKKQQFWFAHLEAADNTGLSIADYAKANNLDARKLYQWRSTLNSKSVTVSTEARFTRVITSTPLPSQRLTVQAFKAQLQFDALPDPEWLAVLLSHAVVRP